MMQHAIRPVHTSRSLRWLIVTAGLATLTGCTEKSRSPLSPNIAGPIAGVNISTPLLVSPADGTLINVEEQPVRVTFLNGESNGERPVSYDVTVSTTAEFTDMVHEATGIAPDPSGQTTYALPTALDAEQMYYWRAQADDGANASEASGVSTFEVYTPVEIAAPQIQTPSGGSGGGTSGGEATTLVITAPVVSGPASNIQWELQVAEDPGFSAVVVSLSGPMPGASLTIDVGSLFGGSSQSLTASSLDTPTRSEQAFARLKGNTQYHWRARVSADGREGTVVGPWSPSPDNSRRGRLQ